MGATIHIGQEMLCLQYAGFLWTHFISLFIHGWMCLSVPSAGTKNHVDSRLHAQELIAKTAKFILKTFKVLG